MLRGHVFICLSKRNQESVPDSEERMMLQLSGLGERKINFCLDADNQEIYEILSTFPKLRGGGGFEMLRVSEGGGRVLRVIACPQNGYSVPYLSAVVHNAKVYRVPYKKILILVRILMQLMRLVRIKML